LLCSLPGDHDRGVGWCKPIKSPPPPPSPPPKAETPPPPKAETPPPPKAETPPPPKAETPPPPKAETPPPPKAETPPPPPVTPPECLAVNGICSKNCGAKDVCADICTVVNPGGSYKCSNNGGQPNNACKSAFGDEGFKCCVCSTHAPLVCLCCARLTPAFALPLRRG
jgi:hypothetical protein